MTVDLVPSVKSALVELAGGYLRNPGGAGTCSLCFTPTRSLPLCPTCDARKELAGLPDAVGFLSYAGYLDPIAQSGTVMRGYKNPYFPPAQSKQTVSLMAALGLLGHRSCPRAIVGAPVKAWATVPSLPPKGGMPHPLNRIVRRLSRPGSTEIVLRGATKVTNPRAVNVDHYRALMPIPANTHVLLVDDTWTGGGHALSATLALRAAGASRVSLLVLARWLRVGWEATTAEWAKSRLTAPDFDADRCPWTQSQCPGGGA